MLEWFSLPLLGWVNDGSWQVQFSIGRPVSEGTLLDDL